MTKRVFELQPGDKVRISSAIMKVVRIDERIWLRYVHKNKFGSRAYLPLNSQAKIEVL